MAKGQKLESSQRGIAFSTISALEVSVLILIVGAGTFHEDSDQAFSIAMLADLIRSLIGEVGVVIFSVGFIAAALSSMLAVPLGAALTADSLFSRCEEEENCQVRRKYKVEERVIAVPAADKEDPEEDPSSLTPLQSQAISPEPEQQVENSDVSASDASGCALQDTGSAEKSLLSTALDMEVEEKAEEEKEEELELKTLPRPVYWAIITVMVVVATVVISLNGESLLYLLRIIFLLNLFNNFNTKLLTNQISICLRLRDQ